MQKREEKTPFEKFCHQEDQDFRVLLKERGARIQTFTFYLQLFSPETLKSGRPPSKYLP